MKLLLATLVSVFYIGVARRVRCKSFCKYRFCANLIRDGPQLQRENRAVLLGVPNVPLGPFPCRIRDGKIQILSNVAGGEALVSNGTDDFVPISMFKRDTATPDFQPNFFSWITKKNTGRTSLARRPSKGNLDEVINQACVRMPVDSFDILRKDGSVRKSIVATTPDSCVGFRTRVPKLLVSFEWTTANDFDLTLEEPNGFVISRFGESRRSPNGGKFIFDVGGKTVCQNEFSREQIRYIIDESVIEEGVYIIRVHHQRACSPTSDYILRVYHDGKVVLRERGEVSRTGENVVVSKFSIPRTKRK